MRIRHTIFIFLLVVLVCHVYSQDRCSIRGRVLDNVTKDPVSGVNVIVRGEKKGTMTDTAGYFHLELLGRQSRIIAFSHIAYEKEVRTASFDSTDDVRFRIYLSPDTIKLKEIVITGRKQIVPSEAAEKSALYSFSGDEFERLGEEDMERALRYMLPDIIKRREVRMLNESADFTLYVDGEWKESLLIDEIDPFNIRRVKVWGWLGKFGDIDAFPIGYPLHRGNYVILIDTKQK